MKISQPKRLLPFLFFILSANNLIGQPCNIGLTNGKYWGKNTTTVFGQKSDNTEVDILINESNNVTISDLTTGLLSKLGFSSEKIEAKISIDCSNQVIPTEFKSSFGYVKVLSGSWNNDTRTLYLEWSIPFNEIFTSSEFKLIK